MKRTVLASSFLAAFELLVVLLYALGFVGMMFGPYQLHWLGALAFFLTIPCLGLFLWLIHPDYVPLSERVPRLRPCRRIVAWAAGACLCATIVGFVGLMISMPGPGLINADTHAPIIRQPPPYSLDGEPVSRARWLAASVSFAVAWHGFGTLWVLVALYCTVFEPESRSAETTRRSWHR